MNLAAFATSIDKYDGYIFIAAVLGTWLALKLHTKTSHDTWDHFWQNLDKFLLTGLFLLSLVFSLVLVHHHADQPSLTWIEDITKQLLTAILTILGVKAFTERGKNGANGNGNGGNSSPDYAIKVPSEVTRAVVVVDPQVAPQKDPAAPQQ